MDASKAPSADGRLLGTLTAAACHDLMNVFATFNQALGLMDDCLAADAKTTRRTFGLKGGFAYRERFVELNAMLRGQLARAVGLTEALALAAHSVDGQGRTVAPPEALAALVALAERLLKRRKITGRAPRRGRPLLADAAPGRLPGAGPGDHPGLPAPSAHGRENLSVLPARRGRPGRDPGPRGRGAPRRCPGRRPLRRPGRRG
jgi:hypothetical protein